MSSKIAAPGRLPGSHLGAMLRPFWSHFGSYFEPFWNNFGFIFEMTESGLTARLELHSVPKAKKEGGVEGDRLGARKACSGDGKRASARL